MGTLPKALVFTVGTYATKHPQLVETTAATGLSSGFPASPLESFWKASSDRNLLRWEEDNEWRTVWRPELRSYMTSFLLKLQILCDSSFVSITFPPLCLSDCKVLWGKKRWLESDVQKLGPGPHRVQHRVRMWGRGGRDIGPC